MVSTDFTLVPKCPRSPFCQVTLSREKIRSSNGQKLKKNITKERIKHNFPSYPMIKGQKPTQGQQSANPECPVAFQHTGMYIKRLHLLQRRL